MIAVPARMPGYSTLGDLYLRATKTGAITGYRRQLDLETGVVRISYNLAGVHYTREVFASVPDEVIVLRLSADKKGAISFRTGIDRPEDFAVNAKEQNALVMREGPEHKGQIHFAAHVLVLPSGGEIHAEGSQIAVSRADSVTILLAAATDFKGGPFAGGNPDTQCERVLSRARTYSAELLLRRQLALYQPLYRRTSLHLGAGSSAAQELPTDERIKRVSAGADDLGLQQLYFQFARYLLISSSRVNGLPANLQGIWASGITNPWESKWTINANIEMNYWLAEPAGLAECMLPPQPD
jgi:alpha-L-fucosidase 2